MSLIGDHSQLNAWNWFVVWVNFTVIASRCNQQALLLATIFKCAKLSADSNDSKCFTAEPPEAKGDYVTAYQAVCL